MPCGCFGKPKKSSKDKFGGKTGSSDEPDKLLYNSTGETIITPGAPLPSRAVDNKQRPEDDPDKANRRRDVVASYYSDQCELLTYKPTGSRPASAYTSADTVPLLGTPPSPPAATSSPAPSSPTSCRSGASCRAELAEKRREFFRELQLNGTPQSSTLPSASRLNSMNNKRPNSHPSSDVTTRTLFNGQLKVNLKSAKLPRGKDPRVNSLDESIDDEETNGFENKPPTPPPPYEGDLFSDKNTSFPLPSPPPSPTHLKSQITSEQLRNVQLKRTPIPQPPVIIMSDEEIEKREFERMEMDEKDNELFSLIETSEIESREEIDELMNIIEPSNENVDLLNTNSIPPEIQVNSIINESNIVEQSKTICEDKEPQITIEPTLKSVTETVESSVEESSLLSEIPTNTVVQVDNQSVTLPTSNEVNQEFTNNTTVNPPSLQETLKQIPPPQISEELNEFKVESEKVIKDADEQFAQLLSDNSDEIVKDLDKNISDGSEAISGNVVEVENICVEEVSDLSASVQMDLLDHVSTKVKLDPILDSTNSSSLSQMVSSESVEPSEFDVDAISPLPLQPELPCRTVIDKTLEIETSAPSLSNNEQLQEFTELLKSNEITQNLINEEPSESSTKSVVIQDDGKKIITQSTVTTIPQDGESGDVIIKKQTVVTSQVVDGNFPEISDSILIQGGPVVTKVIKQTVEVDSESDIPKLTNVNILETNTANEELLTMPQENTTVTFTESSSTVPLVVDQASLQSIIDRSNGLSMQHLASEISATLQENLQDGTNESTGQVTTKTTETPLIMEDDLDNSEIPELININTGHVLDAVQLPPHIIQQTLEDVRLPQIPEMSETTSDILPTKNVITINETKLQSSVGEQRIEDPSSPCEKIEDKLAAVEEIQDSPPSCPGQVP